MDCNPWAAHFTGLAKFGADGDFQHRYLTMYEIHDSELICRGHSFDEDDLAAALAMADEWLKQSPEPGTRI